MSWKPIKGPLHVYDDQTNKWVDIRDFWTEVKEPWKRPPESDGGKAEALERWREAQKQKSVQS
jgi:hypothetical protein